MAVKVHYTTREKKERYKRLRAAMETFRGSYVTVGVHEDAGTYEVEEGQEPVPVAKVAFWLENGTQFMPARPFFYPTIAHYQDKIQRVLAQGYAAVAFANGTVEHSLARLGFVVQSWVQNTIKSNVGPPLSAAYLRARKKRFKSSGDRTLIASGLLLRSIRYKVSIRGGEPISGPAEGPDPKPLPATKDGQKHDADTAGGDEARALAREMGRQLAAARKAREGFQRLAAKLNPQRQKAEFGKQRRAFKTFKKKAPK